MMFWKQYFLSILICSLICGIVSQLVTQAPKKKMMQLLSGIVLALSVLTPLTKGNFADSLCIPDWDWNGADFYTAEGKKIAAAEKERYIKAFCEAYILDKAKSFGTEVTVCVSLDEMLIPIFAEVHYDGSIEDQTQLQNSIATDLGIPKENQTWIWNQQNSNS